MGDGGGGDGDFLLLGDLSGDFLGRSVAAPADSDAGISEDGTALDPTGWSQSSSGCSELLQLGVDGWVQVGAPARPKPPEAVLACIFTLR